MYATNPHNYRVVWGVSALHHDAALAVIALPRNPHEFGAEAELLYASHAERYSRKKNDPLIHKDQIDEALGFGRPTNVYWYENPISKRARWLASGNIRTALSEPWPAKYMDDVYRFARGPYERKKLSAFAPMITGSHHKSHLYSLVSTNPYRTVRRLFDTDYYLIVDAIGEFQTTSLWQVNKQGTSTLIKEERYPRSLGLLYAAMTQHLGLKPMEEEYIVMGMAAYGKYNEPVYAAVDRLYTKNLQRGIPDDEAKLLHKLDPTGEDTALALQALVRKVTGQLLYTHIDTREHVNSIGIGGGVGLNCVNNQRLATDRERTPLWVYPNAGDAGTSIGAVMQHYPNVPLRWSPFSGTDMGTLSTHQVALVVRELLNSKVCGVAHRRAEFGPRALGCRSILGDPRDPNVKNLVNQYKNRQQFRPLAPMVLAEHAETYFDIPYNLKESARYMQVTVNATDYGKSAVPAVIHVDGTARVQVVHRSDPVYPILRAWTLETGCPVLMNTSLNVRGQPLVNVHKEVGEFHRRVGIEVITPDSN